MTDAAHTGGVGGELRPKVDPELVERLMADAGEEPELLVPDGRGPSHRNVSHEQAMRYAGQAVTMAIESRGASHAKAKRELGWGAGRHASWRQGFAAVSEQATGRTSAPGSANAEWVGSSSR